MNFNSLVFPAPKPSYNTEILGNELIWIPSYKFPNGNKSTQSQQKKLIILKNEKKDLNLSDLMFIEDPDMENSIPNYMTPQASISKKFDFDSYNKRFNDSKYKTSGNNTNNQLEHNSYENYEEKDADFKPKNIEQYYTKTLDHMNAFTKYSSNNNSVHRENTNHQSFNSKINASYIPSLLLEVPLSPNPKHIVLFFHGNGEDIFLAYELIDSIRQTLKVFPFTILFFI